MINLDFSSGTDWRTEQPSKILVRFFKGELLRISKLTLNYRKKKKIEKNLKKFWSLKKKIVKILELKKNFKKNDFFLKK